MNPNYPKNFRALIKPIQREVVFTVLLSFFGTLSLLIAPLAITIAVGKIMAGDESGFFIWMIGASFGLVLKQILHTASLGYAHVVEAKFRHRLRKDFSDKLSRLPLGFFSETSSGAIRKFISEDTAKAHTVIAHGFSDFTAGITLPIGCGAAMIIFEWHTGLMILGATFLLLFVGMVWMRMKTKRTGDINTQYEMAQRTMSHGAIEMVDGIKEIKNFGLSGAVFRRFDDSVHRFSTISFQWLNTSSKPMTFVMAVIQPTMMLFLSLLICLFSIHKQWLSLEGLILFVLLSISLPSSLMSLMQIGNHIRDGRHSIQTLLDLYQKEDQVYLTHPQKLVAGDIAFEEVSFSYDGKNPVLKHVSCIMKKGSLTALVGASGSGKTTMARLIARFWDAQEGRVLIGGVDVKAVSAQDLLSNVSLVFQDVSLMHASILENIALSKPNASKEEVIKAAKAAMIHDSIMKLPQGYESVYGEDSVILSGGERQRITIARAFLADAPIILLDEATAQADAESEVAIQKALSRLRAQKTVVMIAHRLSSIMGADQILVLEEGEIKAQGKHEDLLATDGIYKAMWQAQHQKEDVAS